MATRASTKKRDGEEGARGAQAERTELHLMRTATWLFSERGFHGTGIRQIAEAAEVAVSAMYYYASSKDELLEAVIRGGLDRLTDGSKAALKGIEGPSERLATLIGLHVALHARNPRTTRVVDQEFRALAPKARKQILAQRDAYEQTWEDVLTAGAEAGEFLPRGRVGRLALLQMCTGVAHWYQPRGELNVVELCDRFADMGLALFGATRDGKPVTVDRLDLPSAERLLELVEIVSEPRRKPAGVA